MRSPALSQRLSSITTRIKIYYLNRSKQYLSRQRLSSITTRIKIEASRGILQSPPTVRDYLPLQQGLRYRVEYEPVTSERTVRDYLPLQQGLRSNWNTEVFTPSFCQRLSSITTRIKILSFLRSNVISALSETIFHYNKD